MYVMLYSVPKNHWILLFRGAQISLLGEPLSSSWVAFRSKIIKYQNIEITIVTNISILWLPLIHVPRSKLHSWGRFSETTYKFSTFEISRRDSQLIETHHMMPTKWRCGELKRLILTYLFDGLTSSIRDSKPAVDVDLAPLKACTG